MDCPFCNYAQEAERTLEATHYWMVILSNPRLVEGHTLIIPRRHLERINALETAEWAELQGLLAKYEQKIVGTFGTGCDIKQHYRPFIPNGTLKQGHLHFHLIPRSFEDEQYLVSQVHETALFEPLSAEEQERVLQILRS